MDRRTRPFHEVLVEGLEEAVREGDRRRALMYRDLASLVTIDQGHAELATALQAAGKTLGLVMDEALKVLEQQRRRAQIADPSLQSMRRRRALGRKYTGLVPVTQALALVKASHGLEPMASYYQGLLGQVRYFIRTTREYHTLAALSGILSVEALPKYLAEKYRRKLAYLTKATRVSS